MLRALGNNAIASVIMRVSCPSCQTEYEVPDAALTGRARTLRCSNCMTKWRAEALQMYRPEPAETTPVPSELETLPKVQAEASESLVLQAPEADAAMAAETAATTQAPQRPTFSKPSWTMPEVKQKPPARRGIRASLLLVLLIIVIVLAEHRSIGNFWPPSLRLFNALGLR